MSIVYKELLIVDKANRTARKISFKNGINIITSKKNSVGKTSLSLMLLHAFGAKVQFSDKWDINNIFTKLTINQGTEEISIIRYKDTYSIKTSKEKIFFPVQKQGYADKLYELLGLTIKIKDKSSDSYSTAVPSLYLLPYFLSQTKSDEDRSIFLDLHMYGKKDLYDAMYYHVGALNNRYTSLIAEITKTRLELEKLKREKDTEIQEIEYLEQKLEENKSVKIVEADKDLEADLSCYEKFAIKNQEFYTLARREAEIKRKIKLLQNSLTDNTTYTNRLLNEEEIRCPVCKTDLTDFISAALNIGMAESEITGEIGELKGELLDVQRKMSLLQPRLESLRNEILLLEQKREGLKITRAIIVWNEELKKAKNKFATTQLLIDSIEKKLKELGSQQKQYSDRKQSADVAYRTHFSSLLDAVNVNKHGVNLDGLGLYQSVNLSGSEIPRVAIAKFFALLESKYEESIVMPIIFDFPNLDMTEENLIKCFKIMCDKIKDTSKYPQSFIFSIDCEERIAKANCKLESAHVIDMGQLPMDNPDNPQLLCKQDFITYSKEINEMLQ